MLYKIVFFAALLLTLFAVLQWIFWFSPTANSSYNQGFLVGNILLTALGVTTCVLLRKKAFQK